MSKRCAAKNRNGKRCGAWALRDKPQCALHSDPERAAAMGSKHGRKMTVLFQPDPLDPLYRPLKSPEEICEVLEETINRVRQGAFDLRAANTIGFLSGVQLKALSQRTETQDDKYSQENVYTSLFQRLGSAAPEEEVFDLYPQLQQNEETPAPAPPLALSGSIDARPATPDSEDQIITVEIGD
jgi:hypothetical protein